MEGHSSYFAENATIAVKETIHQILKIFWELYKVSEADILSDGTKYVQYKRILVLLTVERHKNLKNIKSIACAYVKRDRSLYYNYEKNISFKVKEKISIVRELLEEKEFSELLNIPINTTIGDLTKAISLLFASKRDAFEFVKRNFIRS